MKFSGEMTVCYSNDYRIVMTVEARGRFWVLVIECVDDIGCRIGDAVELTGAVEIEGLLSAFAGSESFSAGPLTVDGVVYWTFRNGIKKEFQLNRHCKSVVQRSLEYLIPIFALGVEV